MKDWYNKIAKSGAASFEDETGHNPGIDNFYFSEKAEMRT
jgi:hypothetical protein